MRSVRRMDWIAEIIDSRGGTVAVAAAMEIPESTVSSWKSRGSISPGYWPLLLLLPVKRGGKKISLTQFAKLACAADADRLARDRRKTAA
ncbi:carph-isopro domain-containing protein [Bradyrhizobium sp. USDA 3311]